MNTIYNMDCIEGMKRIPDKSVDLILCDLPYGTTACKWDSVIPFEPLWEQYKRLIKKTGVIVLFSSQPFTTALINSNLSWYKYNWYWKKNNKTGALASKVQPMRCVEDICVFYQTSNDDNTGCYPKTRSYLQEERKKTGLTLSEFKRLLNSHMTSHYFTNGSQFTLPSKTAYEKLQSTGFFNMSYEDLKSLYDSERGGRDVSGTKSVTYNPQGLIKLDKPIINKADKVSEVYGVKKSDSIQHYTNYPSHLLEFNNNDKRVHPTQKPLALLEYLIKTYTNEGDMVLDNCLGSGSTAVACVNTGRDYIGFELDQKYFKTACQRIHDARMKKL